MSDKLLEVEIIHLSNKTLLVGLDDTISYVPVVTIEELAADTLNWFEDRQLMIGSKHNPEHVDAWRKWSQEMGVEVHEP